MLARVLWFVVVVVIFSLIKKMVSHFLGGTSSSNQKQRKPPPTGEQTKAISGQTFRDPVCGIHIASSIALSEKIGGETVFFCSEDCRRSYLESKESAPGDI